MERQDILLILEKIFRKILENDNLKLDEKMSMQDIRGWDSIEHVVLITEISKLFKINFSIGEIVSVERISDFIDLIIKKG